jgi:hypothetical protein
MHRFAMRTAMALGADELRVGSWADRVGDANSIDTMSPRPRTSSTCGPTMEFRRNSFRKPNNSWDLTPQIIRPRNRTGAPLGPSLTEIVHYSVCPPLSLHPQRLFPQRKQPHCQHRCLPGGCQRISLEVRVYMPHHRSWLQFIRQFPSAYHSAQRESVG